MILDLVGKLDTHFDLQNMPSTPLATQDVANTLFEIAETEFANRASYCEAIALDRKQKTISKIQLLKNAQHLRQCADLMNRLSKNLKQLK